MSSSDTITIARADLDLLLQRAQFSINAPHSVSVSQHEYDQLQSIARQYENLKRNLLRGGVNEATVALLSQGDEAFQSDNNEDTPASTTGNGGASLSSSSAQRHHVSSQQHGTGYSHSHSRTDSSTNSHGHSYDHSHRRYQGQTSSAWDGGDYDEEDDEDDDVSVEEGSFVSGANFTELPQEVKRHQHERNCNRTLQIVHLAENTTHSDITNSVRGGQLLVVHLRPYDRSASVSFVHAADAQKFYEYCRRNDLYIKNKRVEVKWNERQFMLPGHMARKISSGASRNIVIMNYASQHTEEVIREDLDHIHNLVVIKVRFISGNCHIELNSVHNAIYARTCMLSRMKYKGRKIQFDVDECAQPYPAPMVLKTKEAPQPKRQSSLSNRFQALHVDDSDG
ncbi:hypothetical protein QBC41DRAFT_363847 [Cercophora samala]|uniref:Uncharacterized protein n=1 Tax=Cercophora samala TaxID=330535 RepID=A0AA39ZGG3_9PEZI|nr:hypothetical protein QBC41DRAFT_363847 [Cercophora samala]